MLDFTHRELQVLTYLITFSKKDVTKKLLANYFSISEKTLLKDIQSINVKLISFDSNISIDKQNLIFETSKDSTYWLNLISLSRKIKEIDLIKLRLLLLQKEITLSDFATELYISKSKLEKLLPTIFFDDLKLVKTRNIGIFIIGSELIKYHTFVLCSQKYVDDLNYIISSQFILEQVFENKIDSKSLDLIIKNHYAYVSQTQNSLNTDLEIKGHFITLLLFHYINISEEVKKNYFKKFYQFELTDYKNIINQNIQEILHSSNIIYNKKSTTYEFLLFHLNKLVNNPKEESIDSQILLDVKIRFSFSYSISETILSKLESIFNLKFDKIQTSYIAVYIQTLINQKSIEQNLPISLVSQYNPAIFEYIKSKLQGNLSGNILINTYTLHDYLKKENDSSEILISTIPNLKRTNSLFIDYLPTDHDISILSNQIRNKFIQLKIDALLISDFVFSISQDSSSKTLNFIKEILLNNQLVTKKYFDSLILRLESGLSVINKSLILHGNPREVLENQLLIFKCNNSIDFNNEKIDLIFVILLKESYLQENNDIIKGLYNILQQKYIIESLINENSVNYFKYNLKNKIILKT